MLATAELPETPWLDEAFHTRHVSPSLVGTIKTSIEDFVVTESLAEQPDGDGEHVYLEVTKRGANTAWVAEQIATFAGVRTLDVGYAGRKDRHAVTRQWFSVYLPGGIGPEWRGFAAEGVVLEQVTRHVRKLRRGELRCNQFEIVVRHRSLIGAERKDIEDRLTAIRDGGFPNYFGPQRFGRDLHNLADADRLLRQGERVRGDRGMMMSAARSWLFNLHLSRLVESGDFRDEMGPLFGKSRDPQPGESELGEIYQGWVAGLRRLGQKVGERAFFVTPENMSWNQGDDHLRLSFSLPPGSFATSLLGEIFILEDAAL